MSSTLAVQKIFNGNKYITPKYKYKYKYFTYKYKYSKTVLKYKYKYPISVECHKGRLVCSSETLVLCKSFTHSLTRIFPLFLTSKSPQASLEVFGSAW